VALTNDYPELPEPYNNLAVLYASQGQYEKAKVALEMAIRTHPSYATAHENLGDIYAKMASQAYDRALQLDRSNANTQTKLELIRELVGGKASKTIKTPVAAPATAIVAPPVKPAATARTLAPRNDAAEGRDTVLSAVDNWAAAWSEQDVTKYLSFYAPDFKTPGGEDRAAWEKGRDARISAPKYVHVKVTGAKVIAEDDQHATVTFRQVYQSDRLNSSNTKTLKMIKAGSDWLIQEELSK
jgi:tetratricopeptide (TPR) repeat protein